MKLQHFTALLSRKGGGIMQRVKRRIFRALYVNRRFTPYPIEQTSRRLNRASASRTTKSARNTGSAYQSGNIGGWLMKTFRRFPYIVR